MTRRSGRTGSTDLEASRRIQMLNSEIKHLDGMLTVLVNDSAPSLVGFYGVGTDTVATAS